MAKFNLDEYETVKERKLRFYKAYPKGAIIPELVNLDTLKTHAVFKVRVYETKDHIANNTPRGVGYALEIRDLEKSISNQGKEYESVNYTSWTENAEESAVGRALDNAGFASGTGPSREEMQKVERMSKVVTDQLNSKPAKQTQVAQRTADVPTAQAVDSEGKAGPTVKQWGLFYKIIADNGWDKEAVKAEFLVHDKMSVSDMSTVINALVGRSKEN